jgi:vacuolar-type H+-ATPase subunit C/Vma6
MIAYYVIGGIILAGFLVLIPVGYVLKDYVIYAYTNARLRAKTQSLPDADQLKQYATRSFEDIIYALNEDNILDLTDYLKPTITYGAIDTALRSHHIAAIRELKRITPQTYHRFLTAYLKKFKVRVLKNLVRQQHIEHAETTKQLPRSLRFSLAFRDQPTPGLDDIQQELQGTQLGDIFNEHEDSIRNGDYDAFEHDLNIHLLQQQLKHAPTQTAKTYVKQNIDRLNLSSSLKNTSTYAEGGRLPTEALDKATTINDYNTILTEHNYPTAETKDNLHKVFRQHLKAHADKLSGRQPLSDNIIISYLIEKAYAMKNLNILLKLTYHEKPAEHIRNTLIT